MLTRFSFWSSANKCSTNFIEMCCTLSFSFKISWHDPLLMTTSSAISQTVKWQIFDVWSMNCIDVVCSRSGIFTVWCSVRFKTIKPFIALRSADTDFLIPFLKHFQCVCKCLTGFEAKINTNMLVSIHIMVEVTMHVYFSCSSLNTNMVVWHIQRHCVSRVVASQCHLLEYDPCTDVLISMLLQKFTLFFFNIHNTWHDYFMDSFWTPEQWVFSQLHNFNSLCGFLI